jgi:benzylsuccinate CoA-transferase BbsE subunit
MNDAEPAGPLDGLRVIEVAGEQGQFCGKLMADLGADVIKVEPPGGEDARAIGPFLADEPDPDKSLSFWHYNTSKRGVTLDLECADGAIAFKRLVATADVLLESRAPGHLPSLGLGYEDLRAINDGLVMCSLTPFGQTGPWRDYVSSDLLHLAAGGQMASCGYDEADVPDAPPIAPDGGNAWHTGAHFAYIGIMAALVQRTITGAGQYVDASIHEACALTTESAVASYVFRGDEVTRQTGRHHSPRPTPRTQFRCRDGKYVNAIVWGLTPPMLRRLAEWMDSHGLADDLLDGRYQDTKFIRANTDHIVNDVIANFIANMDSDEIYHGAQDRGFTWSSIRTPDELLDDPHLADREFWVDVPHPELGTRYTYPGSAAIYNGSPWQISRRAPLVGEHNVEVLRDELGLADEEMRQATGVQGNPTSSR